jgi:hypothetical protein
MVELAQLPEILSIKSTKRSFVATSMSSGTFCPVVKKEIGFLKRME